MNEYAAGFAIEAKATAQRLRDFIRKRRGRSGADELKANSQRDMNFVVVVQFAGGVFELLAVHPRAVTAVLIFDEVTPILAINANMFAADLAFAQNDVAGLFTTDDHLILLDRKTLIRL